MAASVSTGAFAGIVTVLTGTGNDDRDDEAVDTKDTSHDDGDDGLDDELGLEHGHGADSDAGLGSAVGSAHVAEDKRAHNAHATEEKSLVGVTVDCTNTQSRVSHRVLGPRKPVLLRFHADLAWLEQHFACLSAWERGGKTYEGWG